MVCISPIIKNDPSNLTIICDISPPRGGRPELFFDLNGLRADFLSVAYNPGQSIRVNSMVSAAWIKSNTDHDVMFTIATRDMNKIAIQSLLLGAQLFDLENILVVQGDPIKQNERHKINSVYDFRPTELMQSIQGMNNGIDFRGFKLRTPTTFSIGGSFNPNGNWGFEIPLAIDKLTSGAEFLIGQPHFSPSVTTNFISSLKIGLGDRTTPPLFCGVQILSKQSIAFGTIPDVIKGELEIGRSGEDIALELLEELIRDGIRLIYLVPPILIGGKRDYETTARVIESARALPI